MTLIQFLQKKGIIDEKQALSLEAELKQRGIKEEELLLEKKVIAEDKLFSLKSENLKVPLKKITPEDIVPEVLELFPEETARHYQMAPLSKKDNFLEVGMVYPENLKAQEALKFLARQSKFDYQIFLITPATFNGILKQYRVFRKEVGMALEELRTELKEERAPKTAEEFRRLAEEAPISKIVAVILRHAVDGMASDIHIEPGRERMRVRFRLLGQLFPSILLPMRVHPAVISRIKILSNLKIDETRIPQDGRFTAEIDNRGIDFRVSTFPTAMGEKVAIRVLDPNIGLKKCEDLGLEKRNFQILKELIQKPYGMILATGPTGSGKTTTLYALLQTLNKEEANIVTLEDPVEYYIEGINQSQIKPEIDYDFARGLRHVLRQDPDIIMVGEIRDEESASLATHAALTGHIVLSTLHTNDALGGIPRLIDLGVRPYLIPPSLNCIIAQRLVRQLCDSCKKEVEPRPEIKEMILREIEELPVETRKEIEISEPLRVFESVGCKKCGQKGFSGRIGIFEILKMTPQLSEIILRTPKGEDLQKEAKRQGMITMFQDGILKVLKGITTIEEVLRVAEEK